MSNTVRAASWLKGFSLAFTKNGTSPIIEWETIASGETIVKGAPVTKASGVISLGATDSGALYGVADADGTAGDVIPVIVGDENNVFQAQADDDTGGISNFPLYCDIVQDADDYWVVNIGTTTEQVLRVIGKVPEDDEDDATVPGRVFFQIHRSQYNGFVAAL
jgi:hypothetical protein